MALAKTTRPSQAETLVRPRLVRRLDFARKKPVTWVWAPPGAGKTTLVASYLAARKTRGLWYQIDEGDADVATFFYYLGLAAPRRRRPLPLLTGEYRHGVAVFARRFFRELYSRLKPPFTLVFDNYQDLPRDSALHDVMAEAVAEIPTGGRVVFISRSEPPPAFARHRLHRHLEILDGSQLRFTPAEAAGLARRLAPGRWPRETIRSLHDIADGWCAGLVLLLEQLRSEGRASPGPHKPSSKVLFDYFAGEILKKADPGVQAVLLHTTFLPRVTGAMAVALTGQPAAGEVLTALHEQNYFTNKQASDAEPVYEYHPLFRDFLLSQALRVYSPADCARIRGTAGGLLAAAGQIEAAARLFRDAEDWNALEQLIRRHAQSLVAQGRVQTLEEWLGGIPAALVAAHPWLLFWRAWIAERHADRQRSFEQALTAFRRVGDAIGMWLAWAGAIFGLLSEGVLVAMERWIVLLDDMLKDTPAFPSTGVEARVSTAMFVAVTLRCPSHPKASYWAERAIEVARRHPDPFTRAITAIIWFHYQLQAGDLARVAVVVDEMRTVMRARDVSPTAIVNASMAVAWYEAATALPSYRQTVARVLELAHTTGAFHSLRETGWRSARHTVLCGGLMGALSDGDLVTAAAWLQELERDVHDLGPLFRSWHHWFIVWEALIRRDVARATTYQPEMLRLAFEAGRALDEAVAHLLSAQVLHARGAESEARNHIGRGLEIGRAMSSAYVEFMARLTEAKLCLDCGQESDGLQALRIAMALGRERGYVNSHIWIPTIMAGLCARALEAGIEPDYVRSLVQKRRLVPESPPMEVEAWPWPIEIVTLGRFEVRLDGEPVRFARKVQRKPLALLKALIAFGGRGVREELVMDALWPDAEGDAARVALASALHRLRGLLGREQAILRQEGRLSLDSRHCWVDIWALERLLGRAETAASHPQLIRQAAALYRGAFLDEREVELPQATAMGESLHRRLLRHLVRVGRQCEQANPQEAVDWYEEALRVDPCAEDACRSLMTVYHRLDRSTDVAATYQRCRVALAAARGRAPSAATEGLFQTLSAR
jgi:ATP/maltotriose-dependent transcriptional regulator MalT/DNA-binding SARP family transcriptional activator